MTTENDKAVLNAMFNPGTPFVIEEEEKPSGNNQVLTVEIQEAMKLEVEGVRAAETGDFKQSLSLFTQAIEKAPQWASAYNNRAQALRLLKDIEGSTTVVNTVDDLHAKHRNERKVLQNKVQALKKTVTKGDKKKKKDIDTQIALMEQEFEEKCSLEIKNFEEKKTIGVGKQPEGGVGKQPEGASGESHLIENKPESNKTSKAKKRKEKKDQEAQKRDEEIALQDIENKNLPAAIELKKIKEKLLKKSLQIKDVRSDGNCMYYAISEQLEARLSVNRSCDELRQLTSEFMLKNQFDFQPYLCSETDGEPYTDEQYAEYCEKIKSTLMWGGQLELRALSDILKIKINVIQADSSDIVIGESYNHEITITYHRHMFGTGALVDLNKAVELAKEHKNYRTLSLALTQRAAIYRLQNKDDESMEDFKLAASLGNQFAKQQTICLNPYAALCSNALGEIFQKLKNPQC